jgi:hypothetical protein
MHVLVTWGTKLGGTEGIAQIIGDVLKQGGFEVTLAPASQLRDVRGYDAAIVGGGLAIAAHYFGARGAHEPLPTALAFAAMFATLDAGVVAALASRSFAMLSSFAGTWLPLALVVLSTWVTGFVISTMPWSKPPKTQAGARNPAGGRDDARHVPVAGK